MTPVDMQADAQMLGRKPVRMHAGCTRGLQVSRGMRSVPSWSHTFHIDGHEIAALVQELSGLAGPHENILHCKVKDQCPSLGANLNPYLVRKPTMVSLYCIYYY